MCSGSRRTPADGAYDDETDFVVAHPHGGALVLEVKGDELRYDASDGIWYSTSKARKESKLPRGPFEQAVQAKYDLKRFLEQQPGWPRRWGPLGHAVAFPDALVRSKPLPDMDPRVVIDCDEARPAQRLAESIEEAFEFWLDEERTRVATQDADREFRMLVDALAHDVHIRQPLSLELDEADREVIRPDPSERRTRTGSPSRERREASGSGMRQSPCADGGDRGCPRVPDRGSSECRGVGGRGLRRRRDGDCVNADGARSGPLNRAGLVHLRASFRAAACCEG